jgi:hypothetical protein
MDNAFDSTMACGQRLGFRADEIQQLREDASRYQSQLDRFGLVAAGGSWPAARMIAQRILRSHRAKVSGVVRTMRPPEGEGLRLSDVRRLTSAMTAHVLAAEQVRLSVKPKLGGGTRPIMIFGPHRRAMQKVCADLISAALAPAPFDYLRPARGVHQMTLDIVAEIERGNHTCVVTADVRNCFGSVRKEGVETLLPLPRWATQNVMLIDEHTNLQRVTNHTLVDVPPDDAARQGLPQGASTSGLVLSRAILGPLLSTAPFADRLFLYGDNMAVPAKDRSEAEAISEALRSLFRNSPAGPLTIGEQAIQNVDEKVHLVMYALKRSRRFGARRLRVMPSQRSYERYSLKVSDLAAKGAPETSIVDYTRRWVAAHRLWEPNALSLLYLKLTAGNASLLGAARLGYQPVENITRLEEDNVTPS